MKETIRLRAVRGFARLEGRSKLDKLSHIRKVYGLLDLLGDCGGLLDALLWIGYFIILVSKAISGSRLDEFLISKILKKESPTFKNKNLLEQIRHRIPANSKLNCILCRKNKESKLH